jgi:farnesyl-diphosphate farnesyltransferase
MSGWGAGISQEEFMHKDECFICDFDDNIIATGSKYMIHKFNNETPRGILHRAFSVFLFNSKGELLLQQRAADKITFPNVWTNTCCSHPITGCTPNERDGDQDLVRRGIVNGVKNAAIRKLEHELGINPALLQPDDFKYLTRLHYWAADVVTHGKKSPWGEHEIDYILFLKKDLDLKPNPEEVSDVKYVTLSELQKMMQPNSGLLWSPWFRIIAEKFLVHWWKDLSLTLTTDTYCDYNTIYRFDPSSEHMGGGGDAGSWLGSASYNPKTVTSGASTAVVGDTSKKQGAYGKVKTHSHSKLSQLSHIDEIFAMVWFKFGPQMVSKIDETNENIRFCNEILGSVSRSFAEVIRQLPRGLCIDIAVFYLVLRALDTIEDDMEAFKGREDEKLQHLRTFYKVALQDKNYCMTGVGLGDERRLLEQFDKCVAVFQGLPVASQEVIADITKRMGEGMAHFAQIDLGQGTVTVPDYNLYCHYVAGLVGEGLTRLFAATKYESEEVNAVSKTLANTMGLFLQKTNIIRDYLEDFVDGRAFWPQQIWKKYSQENNLGEFARPENSTRAVALLNELVTDALLCAPECLEYMTMLRTEEVFRFCAIPQVMAIATLAELYNNPKVFSGVVKIRKGLAVKMIVDTNTKDGLHKWFYIMAKNIKDRIPENDPNAVRTHQVCDVILRTTSSTGQRALTRAYADSVSVVSAAVLVSSLGTLASALGNFHADKVSFSWPNMQNFNHVVLVSSIVLSSISILACGVFSAKYSNGNSKKHN